MFTPNKPEVGMRVLYGRKGYQRTGWKGKIVGTSGDSKFFTVKWEEDTDNKTTYTMQAWAKTQFKDNFRDRDKHYIFFDEKNVYNELKFHFVFSCGGKCMKKPDTEVETQTNEENGYMNKTLVKQTLVNGAIIEDANEEKLIALILDLEANIRHLKSIKVKSTKIDSMVKEYEEAIAATVKELDAQG